MTIQNPTADRKEDIVAVVDSARASGVRALLSRLSGSGWQIKINLLIVILIIGIIASLISPSFLTGRNISNLLQQSSLTGILAMGMTAVILIAGIDLSVGSTAALCGIVVAFALDAHLGIILSILLTLVLGGALGCVMGLISAIIRLPSFIVTLAGLTSISGIAFTISNGQPIGKSLPSGFTELGGGYIGLIPVMGLIFIGIAIITGLILRYTNFGEHIYAMGSSEESARLSGVPVRRTEVLVFTFSGLTAAAAGILLTSQLTVGQPTAFNGSELNAIAAAVLGGTSLFGGRGSVGGTFIAVILLTLIQNVFNILGLGSFAQMIVTGVIIVLALMVNKLFDTRDARRER